MTPHERDDEQRPGLDEAARLAEESSERSQRELSRAHERARRSLSLARWIQRLREENGFDVLFEEAFGGGRRG